MLLVLQVYHRNEMTTTVENQEEKVKEGIDFLLSHFEGRQRLFPRKMSTFASKGKQFIVYNKEQILNACIKSNFKDCRLNAYPVLEDGCIASPKYNIYRFRFTI